MKAKSSIVHVVDDDPSVRTSLERLLRSASYTVETFTSAVEYLEKIKPDHKGGCLILDLRLPGLNGIELQDQLKKKGAGVPIIFITGHGDIQTSVRAMKNGAMDFLSKPFDREDLLQAVGQALKKSEQTLVHKREQTRIHLRVESLTDREDEVLRWVISGLLNKQIALKLGISEKTIKVHRGKVMEKMNVSSIAELVRITERAGINPAV